ncbi:unnamed protein product [Vitrella brassicaformis CCMP3155]|uniref:Uncharacterized protein n=1 Tax=Vitrella brassicaformis (strain CCMP3155) TaxID=1169540 RepID=A0A0G4H0E2_VITBC|nr:unnamed protein product [Vitrella brassicaformis CCMP3155]|eukprot:CEM36982.1 unnamed protein product [Vitrella brassicaformis CCMP3155]
MGWQGQTNDGAFDKVDNTISLLKGLQEHSKNHKYTVVDDEEGKGLRNSGYDVIINFKIRMGDGQRLLFPSGYGLSYKTKQPEKDLPPLDVVERNTCHNPCNDLDGDENWESPDCNLGRS